MQQKQLYGGFGKSGLRGNDEVAFFFEKEVVSIGLGKVPLHQKGYTEILKPDELKQHRQNIEFQIYDKVPYLTKRQPSGQEGLFRLDQLALFQDSLSSMPKEVVALINGKSLQ